MTPRSIRRAQERKALKQARKAEQQPQQQLQTPTISPAQLTANQQNAKLSTGPKTPEGRAISSQNALKTGLTGRTVLLPTDDATLYERHVQSFLNSSKPVGDHETALVQSIADAHWRLARIPTLESGIYALGRLQFTAEFEGQNASPEQAALLTDAKTYLVYNRQLNNLSIQESRLRRQIEKDTAKLADLQHLRSVVEKRKKSAAEAEQQTVAAATAPQEPTLTHPNGFVFSNAFLPDSEADETVLADLLQLPQAA